jgi:type IV secretion system protein VirB9
VVDYDADQVVVLSVAFNYALTVEFSPEERIENVSVGNSAVWQVTANKSADRLFVKPMQGAMDTDMTVVTDTRVYAFELRPRSGADGDMAFLVRFSYPVAPQLQTAAELAGADSASFRFGGARELRPSAMTDDGRSTTIDWPNKAVIPEVSVIGPDGRETLVNGAMRDGRFVVDGVADRFQFHAGGKTAFAVRRVRKAGEQ